MSMYFTRLDKSFRVWFQAVTAAGQLRTGLSGSTFNVNVVSAQDAASITSYVSESIQKPGLYYFDVPATFISANGVGDYGISIQIDSVSGSQTAPHVRSAHSDVLHVTREDFDSISGSVWNTTASSFNTSGTMGYLLNLMAQVSGNTTATAIASDVWNAVAASYNTSGTFGWLENQFYASQSQAVTVDSVVSGVWNANLSTFNAVNTFGAAVNETLQDIKFVLSSSFIASGSVISALSSFSSLTTTVTGNVGQYNGMLLLLKSSLSGAQTRIIDTFNTGTFDVDPPFGFGATGDNVYVVYTQFFPSYGYVG